MGWGVEVMFLSAPWDPDNQPGGGCKVNLLVGRGELREGEWPTQGCPKRGTPSLPHRPFFSGSGARVLTWKNLSTCSRGASSRRTGYVWRPIMS